MDNELMALLESTSMAEDEADWGRLARALQRRGYPSGKDGLKAVRARLKLFLGRTESEARSLLTEGAKRLFDKHPKLESFSWRQYTPYWCDGEPCNFSAYTEYADINDASAYDIKDPELQTAKDEVHEMLKAFGDNYLMFRLFGDHKIVKVNREGIFVETYHHE